MSVQARPGELRALGFIAAHCLASGGPNGGTPGTDGSERNAIKFADGRGGMAECKPDPSFRRSGNRSDGNDFAVCEVTMGDGGAPRVPGDRRVDATPFCIARQAPKPGEDIVAIGCATTGATPQPAQCKKAHLKVTRTQNLGDGQPSAPSDMPELGSASRLIHSRGEQYLERGDSGGPILNGSGEIVGVHSRGDGRSGGKNLHAVIDLNFVRGFADSRGLKVCVANGAGAPRPFASRPYAQTTGPRARGGATRTDFAAGSTANAAAPPRVDAADEADGPVRAGAPAETRRAHSGRLGRRARGADPPRA